MLTIVFRPAALDKLDKDMTNVNIPAIPNRAEDQNPTTYYFGMIRQVCMSALPVPGVRLVEAPSSIPCT